MNKNRRKQIAKLIGELKIFKIDHSQKRLENCINTLEDIKNEEEETFDNMPEGLQYSQRGMDSEAAIESLSDALAYLEETCTIEDKEEQEINIEMAIDCLDDARL